MAATELAKTSKIARPDIYRIIPALQKEGMIEKLMTRPAIFKAIPPIHVLPILLKHKSTKQDELKNKTEALLSEFKNDHTKKELCEANTEFIIVPRKEAMVQRLRDSLLNAQKSVCVVTSNTTFLAAILEFAKEYKEALVKGVKIRIATEHLVAKATALKILQVLSEDHNFEVKYFVAPPLTTVAIYDNKEALLALSPADQLGGAPAIWSNNNSFVALAKNYFESKWHHSTKTYSP